MFGMSGKEEGKVVRGNPWHIKSLFGLGDGRPKLKRDKGRGHIIIGDQGWGM